MQSSILNDSSSSQIVECPSCSLDLNFLTIEERNQHCESHFVDNVEVQHSIASSTTKHDDTTKGFKLKSRFFPKYRTGGETETDEFWYSTHTTSPPPNFTPGLIPLLRTSLIKSHARGSTQKAYLCSDASVHVGIEAWDRGWGCGYRNYIMACTALAGDPTYHRLITSSGPPGVRNLQRIIEQAWRAGYDPEGAEQLKGHLSDTHKWIGTAELYVAFTYQGIPSCLVDFHLAKRGVDLLINWIINYFTEDGPRHTNVNDALFAASAVVVTRRMPLVLQHAGHSRTIIGYERRQDGSVNLLVFDPSRRVASWLRNAALSNGSSSPQSKLRASKQNTQQRRFLNTVLPHDEHSKRRRLANKILPMRENAAQSEREKDSPDDHEVIVIDDSDNENAGPSQRTDEAPSRVVIQDWNKVADVFRVRAKTLAKKDKYQILYFPLTDPLTDSEREGRKTVNSLKLE